MKPSHLGCIHRTSPGRCGRTERSSFQLIRSSNRGAYVIWPEFVLFECWLTSVHLQCQCQALQLQALQLQQDLPSSHKCEGVYTCPTVCAKFSAMDGLQPQNVSQREAEVGGCVRQFLVHRLFSTANRKALVWAQGDRTHVFPDEMSLISNCCIIHRWFSLRYWTPHHH